MKATHPVLFHEVQRFRDVWWVMVLVFGVAATQWYALLSRLMAASWGSDILGLALLFLFWLLFGVGLPLLFLVLRLEIAVYPQAVTIRFAPLLQRVIPKLEIAWVEPRQYWPLGEFGGWGVRGFGGRIAYNVRGNHCVELTLVDGRRVLIGSRRAVELAAAISSIV